MKKVAFGIILSALMVACGSGGGGGDSAQTATQPLAKYVGTWEAPCKVSNNTTPVGVTTYSYYQLQDLTLNSDGTLGSQSTTRYFDSAVCAGTAVGVLNDVIARMRFDSSKTVISDVVELTTASNAAGNITYSGTSASLVTNAGVQNVQVAFGSGTGLIATSQQLAQSASTNKSASKVDSAKTTLSFAETPLDAAGYPTAFNGTVGYVYTKQPVVAAVNPLAKYVGSWTNACSTTGTSTSRNNLITQTLLSNGDLSIANTYRYFNGLTCTGATIAEIVFPTGSARFNSTVIVGASTVDRVFYSQPAGNVTATGSIVTQNATQYVMTYPGGTATEALTEAAFSARAAFKAVGTTQFTDARNPADSAGYPATFTSTPTYTKQ